MPYRTVTGALIQDGTVATADLADGAVTRPKIASGAVGAAQLGAGAVDTGHLCDGAVTTDKIADAAVDCHKVADGMIYGRHLAACAVTPGKIDACCDYYVQNLYSSSCVNAPAVCGCTVRQTDPCERLHACGDLCVCGTADFRYACGLVAPCSSYATVCGAIRWCGCAGALQVYVGCSGWRTIQAS